MAVRLLAGPFDIVDEEGTPPLTMAIEAYYPGSGLLGTGYYDYYASIGTHRITFDGVSQRTPRGGLGSNQSGFCWWPARKRMVTAYYFEGFEVMWEPKILAMDFPDPPGMGFAAIVDQPIHMFVYGYVKMANKWVYPTADWQVHIARVGQSGGVAEGPIWPFQLTALVIGRTDTEVFGYSIDGSQGIFYDVEQQVFTSKLIHTGITGRRLLYVPEWQILISSHYGETSDVFRIWSLEVNPQILSDPEPFIGTPKSGQIVTYRVRLTGAQDDPAPNELVNWELTGVGTLLDVQTTTDDDGYATARVQYLVGETGDSTLEASVQC